MDKLYTAENLDLYEIYDCSHLDTETATTLWDAAPLGFYMSYDWHYSLPKSQEIWIEIYWPRANSNSICQKRNPIGDLYGKLQITVIRCIGKEIPDEMYLHAFNSDSEFTKITSLIEETMKIQKGELDKLIRQSNQWVKDHCVNL